MWNTFNFRIYHLVEVLVPNLKNIKSKLNAAVNCYCCQIAAFALQGQEEGLDFTDCIFFFSSFWKCFNFVLKLLFGYEIYLILHTICNNSHLNWGSNNQPLFNMQRHTTAAQLPWKLSAVPISSFIPLKRALLYTIDL